MTCTWTPENEDESNTWETGCGQVFEIIEGTPEENGFAFCCYCGGKLAHESLGDWIVET